MILYICHTNSSTENIKIPTILKHMFASKGSIRSKSLKKNGWGHILLQIHATILQHAPPWGLCGGVGQGRGQALINKSHIREQGYAHGGHYLPPLPSSPLMRDISTGFVKLMIETNVNLQVKRTCQRRLAQFGWISKQGIYCIRVGQYIRRICYEYYCIDTVEKKKENVQSFLTEHTTLKWNMYTNKMPILWLFFYKPLHNFK